MHPDPRRDIPPHKRLTAHTSRYRGDKLHCETGPAFEGLDGTKAWYADGKLHRDGGPAVEWGTGLKEWYREGQRHREDGPAVEWRDGYKEWWWRGEQCSEREHQYLVLRAQFDAVSGMSATTKPLPKVKGIRFG